MAPGIDRGGHLRLGVVAGRALQHLVGDRLGAGDQACSEVRPVLAACSTCTPLPMPSSRLAMSLARLFRRLRREELGRVVERRVDLVAGGEVVLGRRKQRRGRLQREQVLANRCRKNNTRHVSNLPSWTVSISREARLNYG